MARTPQFRFDEPPQLPLPSAVSRESTMSITQSDAVPATKLEAPAINPYEVKLVSSRRKSTDLAPSQPSSRPRPLSSREIIRGASFWSQKRVCTITFKGGIMKTTLSTLLGDTHHIERPSLGVLVQDCNRDRGTLGDRINRTVTLAMPDLIDNMDHIDSRSAFARYGSETRHGTVVLASTRPDDYTGIQKVTREQFERLIEAEEPFFDIVYNDLGTSSDSPTTLSALAHADVVIIPTNPAEDSVNQAMQTFGWMLSEPTYRDLALKRCILVVNRVHPWTKVEAIVQRFRDNFGDAFAAVTVKTFGWDLKLSFGGRLDPAMLPAARQSELLDICAEVCRLTADALPGDGRSNLTHEASRPQPSPQANLE